MASNTRSRSACRLAINLNRLLEMTILLRPSQSASSTRSSSVSPPNRIA
jgi:hypothetical protein